MAEKRGIPQRIARRLTEIAASGISGRGPSALCTDDVWGHALSLLGDSARIAILSGFFVPAAAAPETDGPTGAASLARALWALGKDVQIWTDTPCVCALRACAEVLAFPANRVKDAALAPIPADAVDLFVYVERLGRARDGRYYNMRKEDITSYTAPLDSYAAAGTSPVVAIGDGGNEVGMGALNDKLAERMPDYRDCLCVVPADVCIPVDVSNWGAYALTTALSVVSGKRLLQSQAEEQKMLEALCACGTVDGVTKRCELSVDGMDLERQLSVLEALEALLPSF